ncbi:phosphotransferase family protein [Halogeometricum borinquense]|uniref:phosphotransferase family protein n=1 Tax=Halogeometricum borinquense TaxID=60847 RepID=UPI003416537C
MTRDEHGKRKRDGHDRSKHDIHRRLESQFDACQIVRQLHNVPPHEVYEVRLDGRRAVYKGDTGRTGNAAVEGLVTAFVAQKTSVTVPEMIAIDDDYYVAAWDPNAPAPDARGDADETWAYAAGKALATLHDETDPLLNQYGEFVARETSVADSDPDSLTVEGSDDWHAAAIEYVRNHRPTLARYGHADIADAVETLLDNRPDAFDGAGRPVCCHGWATPEHVAVEEDEVRCVLDFEHAIAAPGEFDYWRTVLPTFSGHGDSNALRETFREGYESVRTLPAGFDERAPFYVLLNEVYYFESLYVQDQHDPDETAERAERLRERVFERIERLS